MPEFQRPYSWPEDRAIQLYDDLETACVRSAAQTRSARLSVEYFLGALIVTQPSSPRSPYLIVDGQQRLVTLTAVLAILRDRLPPGQFRENLQARIQRPADLAANYPQAPRVELREIDQDVFHRWVLTDGGTARLPTTPETRSTGRLLDALNRLNAEFPRASSEFIKTLATFVLNNCSVVLITASSIDDAYKLFKSVNNPGEPLSALALARTELLGPSAHNTRLCGQIAQAWDEIEDQIGEEELHSYVATVASLVVPGAAQRELFEVVREISRDAQLSLSFNNKLQSFLLAYRGLDSASIDFGPDSDRINRHITCILNAPFDSWRGAALFWLTQGCRASDSYDFFRSLDGLCLGLQILGYRPKAIAGRFDSIIAAVADNSALSRSNSPLFLTESEKRSIWGKIRGSVKKAPFLKNFLLRLNVAASPPSLRPLFPSDVEIEHVLPQKPAQGGEWFVLFPDAQERQRLTHLIGNLTLLTSKKNKSASNLGFRQKKETIFSLTENNCFALTSNVANYPEWTAAVINLRHDELVRHAAEIMSL